MEQFMGILLSGLLILMMIVGVVRAFYSGGVPEAKHPFVKWLLCEEVHFQGEEVTRHDYLKVAVGTLVWRLIVYSMAAIALRLFMDESVPLNFEKYLEQWRQWDANNYTKLAVLGYGGHLEGGRPIYLVFFPLYPLFIKGLLPIIKNVELAALVGSTLCYTIGCCYFYGFVAIDYGKEIAKKSVMYLSIFPFSFYLGAMMPESTFFMCVAACFYYMKKEKWEWVALTGIMASLSRMQGIVLMLPAAVYWWRTVKPIEKLRSKAWKALWQDFYKKALWIPLMSVGTGLYLCLNYKVTGNPWSFLTYQKEHWFQQSRFFGTTLGSIWEMAMTSRQSGGIRVAIWLPEIIIYIIVIVLLIYALRRSKQEYVLYLGVYTIMNYSLSWLISGARYMCVALPMFVFLAVFTEKHKWSEKFVEGICLLGMGIYLVGYLMSKQIM